jgi:hypothetical protein
MIATVHVADLGPRGALGAALRKTSLGDVPGLRWAETALMAPLAFKGPPPVRRVGLLAFWDDEAAVDRFEESHPTADQLSGGLRARLRPLRAFGTWPGLPPEVPGARHVDHEGPVVVFTLGMLRLSQVRRFMKASRPAERAAADDPAMAWGTAGVATRSPFVTTVSIWESGKAAATYAYGRTRPQHSDAITEQQRKDFHRQSAFIRFAPLLIEGELSGKNPMSASSLPA